MNIKEIKSQLKSMVKEHEEVRKSFPIKKLEMDHLDEEHAKIIEKLIEEFGVIDTERFGGDAAKNASLIVQHSTPAIRKKYVELQDILPKNKIYKRGYVYMKDRMLVDENKPQLYATQLKILNSQGDLAFNPIEDFANIDKRRIEMGLEPFEAYVKMIETKTGKKPSLL